MSLARLGLGPNPNLDQSVRNGDTLWWSRPPREHGSLRREGGGEVLVNQLHTFKALASPGRGHLVGFPACTEAQCPAPWSGSPGHQPKRRQHSACCSCPAVFQRVQWLWPALFPSPSLPAVALRPFLDCSACRGELGSLALKALLLRIQTYTCTPFVHRCPPFRFPFLFFSLIFP